MQALVPGLKVWLDVDDGNRSMQEKKSKRPPPQTLEEKYQRAVEIVDSVVLSSWLWYLKVFANMNLSRFAGTLTFLVDR